MPSRQIGDLDGIMLLSELVACELVVKLMAADEFRSHTVGVHMCVLSQGTKNTVCSDTISKLPVVWEALIKVFVSQTGRLLGPPSHPLAAVLNPQC